MMTDPASGIKREVLQLIELQIETLRRDGHLTASDLEQYRAPFWRNLSGFTKNSIESEEPASIYDSPGPRSLALVRGGQAAAPGVNASLGRPPVVLAPISFIHNPCVQTVCRDEANSSFLEQRQR